MTIPESHTKHSRDIGEEGKEEEAVGSQEEWRGLCRSPAAVERGPWNAPPLPQAAGVETCSQGFLPSSAVTKPVSVKAARNTGLGSPGQAGSESSL